MDNDENPQPATNALVGKQLQQAREKAGLSINEVADVQHLRSCVIQAIENSEYSKIDTELFLKGYVRAYAKQVGLNPDELIPELELELEPLRQKREQEYEANPLISIERRRRQKRRIGKLFLLLVIMILVGYLVFTFGLSGSAEVSAQSSVTTEQMETASVDLPDNRVIDEHEEQEIIAPAERAPDASDTSETNLSKGSDTVIVESDFQTESESVLSVPVVVESVEPALAEPGEPLATSDTGILQITFVGDCWVQVSDATGDKLVNSLQRVGDRIDISGKVPLKVVIGAVDAVGSIRFQGEVVNMGNYSVVNNRSEFTLTI